MNNATEKEIGENGLFLAVHQVFDEAIKNAYLKKRFDHWNIVGPPGYREHLHDLPPVYPNDALPAINSDTQIAKELTRYRECAKKILDHYFPPIGDETTIEDTVTCTNKPYHSHPTGTPVVIRRTNKALVFYINPNVHVEVEGNAVLSAKTIQDIPQKTERFTSNDSIGDAQTITKILSQFTSLIPGPEGKAIKFGVDLLSSLLGIAGSSGPSWADITALMREVVREELITNDLEHVQADYSTVKKWSDVQYLPNKDTKTKEELWAMLRPQIDVVSNDINLLLQQNHRLSGFGLLLLGVDLYLSLLQEQASLGYSADIRAAGSQWASDMLNVWDEVQKDRHSQISVKKYSYGVPDPTHYVITCYYWQWKDNKTGETKGDRSGPWQAGGKHDHSESDCRADAEAHYNQKYLPDMISKFGDPTVTADAWKNAKIPSTE